MSHDAPILELRAVEVLYEGIIRALSGISLTAATGEIVALLGANGAGKTTTLKAASSLLSAERGAISAGQVLLRGEDTKRFSAAELVDRGVVQVIEGRRCFPHLSVLENLVSGTLGVGGLLPWPRKNGLGEAIEEVLVRFPRLRERTKSPAGLLSGGEQQMLAIGRALMAKPKILLLDEPSMGLAPLLVSEIFEIVAELNRSRGVTVVLAEQNATIALRYAHKGYVLETGRVVAQGSASELRERDDIKELYLGLKSNTSTKLSSHSGVVQRAS
jgi:branched-chain amino acid transport system ATP-binding protein